MYVRTYVCMYVYIRMYVRTYVCMYVCMYVIVNSHANCTIPRQRGHEGSKLKNCLIAIWVLG